ncbi:hypothetical protein J8L98_21820 [Pseudoalteromonas sp. MMG013]|uniref:hypothetical protein n=1 Tax=Pseudoalteromonas sp. MMG013 TaxID=2822687 RepID=UPI001B37B910|nr:hypothetical protein [Pseudoalteromonas sp. MMG013]MBQ4864333.1 hypothetical protein [Pseudoalteromonas sp. MMG013]
MAQSGHYPQLATPYERSNFLTQFPNAFYQLDNTLALRELPNKTINALLVLEVPDIGFEWAIRHAKRDDFKSSKLYWQRYLQEVSQSQFVRLIEVFKKANKVNVLTDIAARRVLPVFYQDWLALHHGVSPLSLSSSRLSAHSVITPSTQSYFSNHCVNRVLLLTDHFLGLDELNSLREQYNVAPEPSAMSYCFSEPMYIGNVMECSRNNRAFAQCKFELLRNEFPDLESQADKFIVMTQKGRANVRGNIMTLNTDSKYAVFLHELMHFSGFEDEYPVPEAKALWLCATQGQHAPNLYVGASESAPQGWRKSNTCNRGRLQSYKPNNKWSIMEYQSRPLSEQYRMLWQQAIRMEHGGKRSIR